MPPKNKKKDPGKQPEQEEKGAEELIGAQSQNLSPEQIQQILQLLQSSQSKETTQKGSSQPSTSGKSPAQKKSKKEIIASYAEDKLPEQTWSQTLAQKDQKAIILAEMASMTKQEYDLQNLVPSVLKIGPSSSSNRLTISASSSKAIVNKTQTKLDTPYIPKENLVRNIIQIEPEFSYPTPNQVATNVFPSGWHYRPHDIRKRQKYYEFILAHSDSAKFDHKKDKDDPTVITHSTLQILKIITPTQWGQDLHRCKSFGVTFDPPGYNYWDYIEAWSSVFWFQNKNFKHTWFIYFKTRTEYKFPQWFVHWWNFFGPIPEIFPQDVQKAFEHFKQKFNSNGDPFPIDLHYFSKLAGAWIFSWQYRFSPTLPGSSVLPTLQRIPYVRWWATYDTNRINKKAVDKWLATNPRYLCQTEQSKFLNQRSRIQATLAATSTKEDLVRQLSSVLQLLQGETQTSTSQQLSSTSSIQDEDEEEDEDFVVNLEED